MDIGHQCHYDGFAQSMQLILSLPVEQQLARSQVLDSLKLILVKKLPPAVAA